MRGGEIMTDGLALFLRNVARQLGLHRRIRVGSNHNFRSLDPLTLQPRRQLIQTAFSLGVQSRTSGFEEACLGEPLAVAIALRPDQGLYRVVDVAAHDR